MNRNHTPGPWTVEDGGCGIRSVSGHAIATLRVVGIDQGGKATRDANAKLIAAAPDLLEALRIIANSEPMDTWSIVCDFDTLQGVAYAAIRRFEETPDK